MQPTSTGNKAEQEAAKYLKSIGYKIIDLNWKKTDCEIDIVAKNNRTGLLHFFEVKYRSTKKQGEGYEYIDNKKSKQMQYAASRYVAQADYNDSYEIGVISMYGENHIVDFILETTSL